MDGMRGHLLDPSEDLIRQGAAAVAARSGLSPTQVTNQARQLLREEGYGQSPGELYAAIQEVADFTDQAGHAYSLADRAWDASTEADRLGRKAEAMTTRGRRHA